MGVLIEFPRKPVTEPTLPPKALAVELGVSVRTIQRYVENDMPVERTRSGKMRFRLSAVNAWREKNARKAAS